MSTIEISQILTTRNSVNGVKVFHQYYNAGEKVIKYITFSYMAYNSVDDVVACTASGKTEVSGELTGPISPKHESYITWENMWYNPTITRAILTKIHIQYMDNTEEVIDGKDIVFMDDHKSAYYNEVALPEEKARAERAKKEAEEKAEQKKINDRKNELKQAYHCFKVFKCLKKAKEDDEMKFHANQGLWLFILEVIGLICGIIPGVGALIFMLFIAISIFLSAKCIAGINKGKDFEIPVLGKIKFIK